MGFFLLILCRTILEVYVYLSVNVFVCVIIKKILKVVKVIVILMITVNG